MTKPVASVTLFLTLASQSSLFAQVEAPAVALPQYPGVPPAPSAGPLSVLSPDSRWTLVPEFAFVATYDDNLFILPADKKGDTYFQISPGVAFGIGEFRSAISSFAPIPHFLAQTGEEDFSRRNYAYINYTPDEEVFSVHSGNDTFNENLKVAGQEQDELAYLRGDFHYQTETDADIDVGHRIHQSYYEGEAEGGYTIGGKTTAGLKLVGDESSYSGGLSSTEGQVEGFGDYQLEPKTKIGLGALVGDLKVSQSPQQEYEQPNFRITYLPTEKISLQGDAGFDFRQFGHGVSSRTSSVYNLTGTFQAAEDTTFMATARRDLQGSALYAGQDIQETVFQAGARQRFAREFYFSVNGGFTRNDYENDSALQAASRRDDFYFYKFSAARDLTRFGTVQISYEHRNNDSTTAGFGFNENLVSLETSFIF